MLQARAYQHAELLGLHEAGQYTQTALAKKTTTG